MSEPILEKRTCISCGNEMPVKNGKEVIFKRNRHKEGGYESRCTYCIKETQKVVRESAARIQAGIDKLHLDVLRARAKEIAARMDSGEFGTGGVPNVAEMMEKMLYNFGGLEILGLQNAALYLSAPPASPTRQKVSAAMVQLGTKVSQFGFAKKPLNMMTDEELEEAIKESRNRMLTPRLVTDDEEEDIAAAG